MIRSSRGLGLLLALAVLVAGDHADRAARADCAEHAVPAPPPTLPPPRGAEPPSEAEPPRSRMHRQFNAIRDIHRALIVGDLDRARRHARSLARITVTGELAAWEDRVARIRWAARRLAAATSEHAARAMATSLATECASCHLDTADVSQFVWSPEPGDDGSASARMARHEWAAENIWNGLIAPSADRWREGLEALAAAPLPPEAMTDDRERYPAVERLGRRLAAQASRARSLETEQARAAAFADMIGTCAACHALTRP